MTLFADPVLLKMLEAPGGLETIRSSSSWARERWLLPIHSPMAYCTLDDVVPCSIAQWVDFGFLVVFTLEMVLKLTAHGLRGYFRSGWNWLDFIVVVAGYVEMIGGGLPAVNTLRLLKTLRPLRSVQRIRGMRVLVQCILEALPQLCNVLVFLLFFLVVMAVLGVSLFKGRLRYTCHDYDAAKAAWVDSGVVCDADCTWSEATLELLGECGSFGNSTRGEMSYAFPDGRWTYSCRPGQQCRCALSGSDDPACSYLDNPNYGINSFDSVAWAMITLFQAITLEGWVDVMYVLMDSTSMFATLFMIPVTLFGGLIIINLFLAVLVQEFDMADNGAYEDPEVHLLAEDEGVIDAPMGEAAMAKALAALRHASPFRQRCLELVRWRHFDRFIMWCILFNTLTMMLKYAPAPSYHEPLDVDVARWDYLPQDYYLFLAVTNVALTAIFALESAIKMVALGPRLFVRDRLNLFDLIVVLFSIVEIVIEFLQRFLGHDVNFPSVSVLRTFRAFRLFKLAKSVESMRNVFTTLSQSASSVAYLAMLLCLMILIFILLGMELFGGYYPRPELNYTVANFEPLFDAQNISWPDEFASRYHFDDFGNALLAVFVVLSGENWNEIMFDSHRATWDHDTAGGLGLPFAVPYFILLFIVGNLILFNLFVAILLANFGDEDEEAADDDASTHGPHHVAASPSAPLTTSTATPTEGGAQAKAVKFACALAPPSRNLSTVVERNSSALSGLKAGKDAGKDTAASRLAAWVAPSPVPTPKASSPAFASLSISAPTEDPADADGAVASERSEGRNSAMSSGRSAVARRSVAHQNTGSLCFEFGGYKFVPNARLNKDGSTPSERDVASHISSTTGLSIQMPSSSGAEPVGALLRDSPLKEISPRLSTESQRAVEKVMSSQGGQAKLSVRQMITIVKELAERTHERSLYCFSWDHPLRRACARIISHAYFEPCVIMLIITSTILLILDMPHLALAHPLRVTNQWCNIFFTIIFAIEAFLKVITSGFVLPLCPGRSSDKELLERELKLPPVWRFLSRPYLHDEWNRLDFFIVIVSIVSLFTPEASFLRALRALRPLRLVSRYEDLKVTVDTLLMSIPAMVSFILVSSLFFVIFSILGTELFGGRLGYCLDPKYADLPYGSRILPGMNGAQTDYEECMALERYNLTRRTTDGILLTDMADAEPDGNWLEFVEFPQWSYPQWGTFDNFFQSFLLLFELSALEGWPDVLHRVMDADQAMYVEPYVVSSSMDNGMGGVDLRMHEHAPMNAEAAIFFVAWIVLGCFVLVNLTVGVVVDTFDKIKKENDGALLMTREAAEWVHTQKELIALRPLRITQPPKEQWRYKVYLFITSTRFEVVVMIVIALNMLQIATMWWEPAVNSVTIVGMMETMQYFDYVFIALYTLEILVKWAGLTIRGYFKERFNVFDFLLVSIAYLEIILTQTGGSSLPIPPTIIRVVRLFRIVRVLRIVRSAKGLRTIMLTVWISLPQLKNIMMLILLIIIITNLLCVNMFFAVNYTPGNFDLGELPRPSLARGERVIGDETYVLTGEDNWGEAINRHANFGTFWTGFLTLIRSATGESFNALIHDLCSWDWGHNRLSCCPQCGPILDGAIADLTIPRTGETLVKRVTPEDSCGNTSVALIIYFFFQVIMAYIVLSIMIGVILENFSDVGSDDRKISIDDIEEFREAWLRYDRDGSYVIGSHNLLPLLQSIPPPLGYKGRDPPMARAQVLKLLGALNIPDHGGRIHFTECLTAISYHHFSSVSGVPELPDCDTTKRLQKTLQGIPKIKMLETPSHNSLTTYLISLMSARFRAYAETHLEGAPSAAVAEPARGGSPGAEVPLAQPAPGNAKSKFRVEATTELEQLPDAAKPLAEAVSSFARR